MIGAQLRGAAESLPARVVDVVPTTMPASFNGGQSLFLWNLFLMTAFMFLGVMMAGKQARRIWTQRHIDHPLDPVSLVRFMLFFAGTGIALRCGAEAMMLWGWNPSDPVTTARFVMAKRWIDPIAVGCGGLWMLIAVLGEPGIEHQLRKAPLPVDMWSRWPALVRPAIVVVFSFIAALAVVCLR